MIRNMILAKTRSDWQIAIKMTSQYRDIDKHSEFGHKSNSTDHISLTGFMKVRAASKPIEKIQEIQLFAHILYI